MAKPKNADSWSCDPPANDGKVSENTRCNVTCLDGHDWVNGIGFYLATFCVFSFNSLLLFQDKKRDFHKCLQNGNWQKPNTVQLSCEPNGILIKNVQILKILKISR